VAKKRTVKPFYGKANQRLEATARTLFKAGREDDAKELFRLSDELIQKKKAKR
jgi:hypothetical protein